MDSTALYPFYFDHLTVRNRPPSATVFDIFTLMAPHLVESVDDDDYDRSEHSALNPEDEDPRFKDYNSEVLDRKYTDELLVTLVKARLTPRTGGTFEFDSFILLTLRF